MVDCVSYNFIDGGIRQTLLPLQDDYVVFSPKVLTTLPDTGTLFHLCVTNY